MGGDEVKVMESSLCHYCYFSERQININDLFSSLEDDNGHILSV